jgi:hypothetical protein
MKHNDCFPPSNGGRIQLVKIVAKALEDIGGSVHEIEVDDLLRQEIAARNNSLWCDDGTEQPNKPITPVKLELPVTARLTHTNF